MCVYPDTATIVIKAVVALHKYLMIERNLEGHSWYCPNDFVDRDVDGRTREGSWREEEFNQTLCDMRCIGSSNYSQVAKKVRDSFRDYFNSDEGSVPWQLALVESTTNSFDE